MIYKIFDIFNKPYPYYIPYSSSIKLLAAFSILIPVFLIIFQPFGLENWQCEQGLYLIAGMSIPIFLSLLINFYGVSKLWSWFFNEDAWNIAREIVWSLWNILVIIVFNEIYWHVVPYCPVNLTHFGTSLFHGLLISIFPAALCISVNYIRALNARLRTSESLNRKLIDFHKLKVGNSLELVGENDEKLSIPIDELLYIQSYDNYAKVVWNGENNLMNKLIRSSLKNLENQITESFITRCHRSFIVNLAKVEKVVGNARGYKLCLKDCFDPIPVSRDNSGKVFKQIQLLDPVYF